MFFRNLSDTGVFAKLERVMSLDANEKRDVIYAVASDIIEEAEAHSLRGDLWELFFAMDLVRDENPLSRAFERKPLLQSPIFGIASQDIWNHHKIITGVKSLVANDENYENLRPLFNYVPTKQPKSTPGRGALMDVERLAAEIAASKSPEGIFQAFSNFTALYGAGRFALDCAFRWSGVRKELVPVRDLDPRTLDSLVGYEEQKKELLANTDAFLEGMPANNVLLFGDSGTGKSSSIRALVNEPDFVRKGLRVIELQRGDFADIPALLDGIRGRNYRFIIFMDDLSFEEFEVEYKYLKALIEGGLESRPENVVIYATSNRRNIIREVWNDRAAASDDVHGRDTMQERQSLADRFGITIWFPSASKENYLAMVRSIASELNLAADGAELEKLAMRWELGKGGFTGRTARQFVQRMLLG